MDDTSGAVSKGWNCLACPPPGVGYGIMHKNRFNAHNGDHLDFRCSLSPSLAVVSWVRHVCCRTGPLTSGVLWKNK